MKEIFALSVLLFYSSFLFSQETMIKTLQHDDIERSYILYVPKIYNGDKPVPLVLNFHGYTSNATQQMAYGDFRPIADTANFIIVHPEGTLLEGKTHFNVGGWTTASKTNDVGFAAALIEELGSTYNIDMSRVYSTGMSNGGYMSFLLACQLNHKIAAIASVTGSMTPQTYGDCDSEHPTPILQMHGTSDPVVPYDGDDLWTKSIPDVISFWCNENGCKNDTTFHSVPDTNKEDGSTVVQTVFKNCKNNSKVIHYKVEKGAHQWPGSVINRPGTNQDFNASLEIWKFLSQYNLRDLTKT